MALVAVAALALASDVGARDPSAPYAKESRVVYIEEAIVALRDSYDEFLRNALKEAHSALDGTCSASSERLRVECLVIVIERRCEDVLDVDRRRCKRAMDVAVANALAAERLIPREERVQILVSSPQPRTALARELRSVQGRMAVDFRAHAKNTGDPRALASEIDRYCLGTADDARLAYQACVSSLLWYMRGVT
jgi:hypothetical protein